MKNSRWVSSSQTVDIYQRLKWLKNQHFFPKGAKTPKLVCHRHGDSIRCVLRVPSGASHGLLMQIRNGRLKRVIHIYIYRYIYIYNTYIHTYITLHTYIHPCMHTYIHTYTHIYMGYNIMYGSYISLTCIWFIYILYICYMIWVASCVYGLYVGYEPQERCTGCTSKWPLIICQSLLW